VDYAKNLLDEVGLGQERLEMVYVGASDAPIWAERVADFTEKIRALGPNPLATLKHVPMREASKEALERIGQDL
jgi:coenzyme F420-reducing hydrogenase delta subunit